MGNLNLVGKTKMKILKASMIIIIFVVLSAILYIDDNSFKSINSRMSSIESRTNRLISILNDSIYTPSNQIAVLDTIDNISFVVESNLRNIVAIKSGKILWNVNPIRKYKDVAGMYSIVDSISTEMSSDRIYVWWSNGLCATINKNTGESLVFYNFWYNKEKTFLKLMNKKAANKR